MRWTGLRGWLRVLASPHAKARLATRDELRRECRAHGDGCLYVPEVKRLGMREDIAEQRRAAQKNVSTSKHVATQIRAEAADKIRSESEMRRAAARPCSSPSGPCHRMTAASTTAWTERTLELKLYLQIWPKSNQKRPPHHRYQLPKLRDKP